MLKTVLLSIVVILLCVFILVKKKNKELFQNNEIAYLRNKIIGINNRLSRIENVRDDMFIIRRHLNHIDDHGINELIKDLDRKIFEELNILDNKLNLKIKKINIYLNTLKNDNMKIIHHKIHLLTKLIDSLKKKEFNDYKKTQLQLKKMTNTSNSLSNNIGYILLGSFVFLIMLLLLVKKNK